VGEYGSFKGTLQQDFCPCGGGNVGTSPYSRGECGHFVSVQLSGDWEQSIACSIDGKMAEEKKNRRYVFAEPYTFVINRDKFRTATNC